MFGIVVFFRCLFNGVDEIVIESILIKNDIDEDLSEEQKFYLNVEIQIFIFLLMCIDNFEKDDVGIYFYIGFEIYVKFYMVLRILGLVVYCLNYIYYKVINISVLD